jgi:hypothetical protein
MTSFFKRMMNPGGRPATENGPARLALGAFGKHPGWNDHIPGIGLETEALAHVKHALYVSGIGGRIDAGAWKSLPAEKRLEGFQHTFLWLRNGHALLGRLDSSEDALHRKEYPLVFCVDCEGIAPEQILARALPEFDRLRAACQATSSPEQVAVECRMAQDRLRDYFLREHAPGATESSLSSETRRRFFAHQTLGPDRVGLLRILHELSSAGSRGGSRPNAHSAHLRLPRAADTRGHALLLWAEFLLAAVPANVPLLLISRDATDWIDAIVGEPNSDDFFCLQATPAALPLASQIPYDLTPELTPRLQQLEAKIFGVAPAAAARPAGATPANVTSPAMPNRAAPPARKGFKWLMGLGGIVLVLAGGAGVWLLSGNRGSPLAPPPPTAASSVPAKVAPAELAPAEPQPLPDATVEEAARLQALQEEKVRLEAEAQRLAAAKKIADDKAREEAQHLAQVAEAAKAAPNQVLPGAESSAQTKAGDEDAGLAQIALAQGNYSRALEISRKWSGTDRFKEILAQIAVETNQLFQLSQLLQAGNYAPILNPTNSLPENARFKEILAQAASELKLLEQARAEFAQGNYVFLQRAELLALQAKPPFQKLFQDGTAEVGWLKKAQALKAQNQPSAVRDLIVQNKLTKPQFAELRQWAEAELERGAGQARDQQQAEALFQQGDYARALELCKKYAGVAAFEAVAKSIRAEQAVLAAAQQKLAEGNYSFLNELTGQPAAAKPQFAALLRQGTTEQTALGELEKLKQANDWRGVQTGLSKQPVEVVRKRPFAALAQWVDTKAAEDEALKAKSPAWLDAELEILLVRFNILSANDRWLQTPEARKEKLLDGLLSEGGKEYYLNRVRWLRAEYTKRNWLTQRDRNKYLDRLESDIRSR